MKNRFLTVFLIIILFFIAAGFSTTYYLKNINIPEIQEVNNSIISTSVIKAEWKANGTVICNEIDSQWYPEVCSDSNGGAVIVWGDRRRGSSNEDIYVQWIDSNGTIRGIANGTPICTKNDRQIDPKICYDGDRGVVIVWNDKRGTDFDIYAQKLNSSAIEMWTSNGTPVCINSGVQTFPEIICDKYGNSIITWHDNRNGNLDIYAQRLDAYGNILWNPNGIPICTESGDQLYPKICSDGIGGAIITWEDDRSGNSDIYTQRVNSSGNVTWATNGTRICSKINDQLAPQICSDGSGSAIITWEDARISNWTIYVQRINSSGISQWTDNGTPICTEIGNHRYPKLCYDGFGGAIITWEDSRSLITNKDIYAQRIDSEGNSKWTPNGSIIVFEYQEQLAPEICSDGTGGAYVTWEDYRRVGISDIYMQWIDLNGIVKLTNKGMQIRVNFSSGWEPKICSDGNHGGIITWYDWRGVDYDIYAQKIINTTFSEEPSFNIINQILLLAMAMNQPNLLDLFSNPLILGGIHLAIIAPIVIMLFKKKK